MAVTTRLYGIGLLNYAKEGKQAVQKIRKALTSAVNYGRTVARQRIASQFRVRTGTLKRQARGMRTVVTVRGGEIKGQVKPLPNLLNIFEHGATLAHGRGHLAARPVVVPAQRAMEGAATKALGDVVAQVGK